MATSVWSCTSGGTVYVHRVGAWQWVMTHAWRDGDGRGSRCAVCSGGCVVCETKAQGIPIRAAHEKTIDHAT